MVDDPVAQPQVEALEALLRKLPDPTTPAPSHADRPKPGRARGVSGESLRKWVRQAEVDAVRGRERRVKESAELKRLRRAVAGLQSGWEQRMGAVWEHLGALN